MHTWTYWVISHHFSTQKTHSGSFTCLFSKEQIASSCISREGRCCLCIPCLCVKPQLPACCLLVITKHQARELSQPDSMCIPQSCRIIRLGPVTCPECSVSGTSPAPLLGAKLCVLRCVACTFSLLLHLCDKDHNSPLCR